MVDSCASGENNGCKFVNVDFLLAELSRAEAFYLDERTENELYAIAVSNIEIR